MIWNNKLERKLTDEETQAIEEAQRVLERAFGKDMFSVSINLDNKKRSEVFGVAFAFDMRS